MSEPRQRVKPAEIIVQRDRGWPDFHPEDFCHRCGNRNVSSWFVQRTEWERSGTPATAIVCPSCFVAAFERATGTSTSWELRLHIENPAGDEGP